MRPAVLGLAAVISLCGSVARAQTTYDPRLQAAVDLAQSGRPDSARAVIRRLLASLSPKDSLYPQVLYAQGALAPDAQAAATTLERVVVEYNWSPWAANALLRMAQLHEAQGDPAGVLQAVERLRRDYPDSPLRPRAAFAGAHAAFDLKDEARGCALIQEALAGAGDDVEFKNQVNFYATRCGGGSGAAAPVPTPAAPPTAGAEPAHHGPPTYTVQVLAVKSAPQVDETLTRLKTMGFPYRVVRDTSGLFKVRVGHYATREEAQRAQSQIKARLGGQPFVVVEP
ncbi:MAG TPA: SPOR domain-containing protein [Gemmatimonadales bacterium]|nr:SPOR domain-containing protein [Gemmatimonadales bacterium]